MSWYYPKGTLVTDTAELAISPEQAGWQYSGLHVANLSTGNDFSLELTGEEAAILSLSAKDVTVTVNGEEFTLAGREGVFDQVSDWIYAPVDPKSPLAQLRVKLPFAPQEQLKFSQLFTPKQVMSWLR